MEFEQLLNVAIIKGIHFAALSVDSQQRQRTTGEYAVAREAVLTAYRTAERTLEESQRENNELRAFTVADFRRLESELAEARANLQKQAELDVPIIEQLQSELSALKGENERLNRTIDRAEKTIERNLKDGFQ